MKAPPSEDAGEVKFDAMNRIFLKRRAVEECAKTFYLDNRRFLK